MWNTGMGTTDIDLIPLNHPEREGFLAARINFIDRATRKQASYFVELRTADRWDQGLPYPAVLIHRSESNRSILVGSGRSNRPNLEWQVGELFHDHANMISIGVLSMDSDGGHAKIRVQLNGAIEYLKNMAYLNWCGRGNPAHDDWTDWFHAEELRRQQLRETAYFHWINRGQPSRDDWADWFWAEKTGTPWAG